MSATPTTLCWKKLAAVVKEKPILTNCTGFCRPGDMLAIMGPSGSGKTTLLSLLARRAAPELTLSGKVQANGHEYSASEFYSFGAFVQQDDLLFQTLTVKETLEFSCQLQIRGKAEAQKRANELIRQFELQLCQDVLVGGNLKKGISGGEKKRLSIAVEMVGKPSLILLDEPTSGLDSAKAARVLRVLRRLADEGHSIVLTIHQPSHLLYCMLSRLLLLSRGEVVFQGAADAMPKYLESLSLAVPSHSTLSDYFMLEISQFKQLKEGYVTPLNVDSYRRRQKKTVKGELAAAEESSLVGWKAKEQAAGICAALGLLLWREWTNYKRNPMKFGGMIGNALIMIIILGLFFLDSIPAPSELIAASSLPVVEARRALNFLLISAQGTSFVNITSNIMVGIFSVALAFPLERPVFSREAASKKYSPISYFLAKIIVELSSVLLGAFLYSSVGFWLLGYQQTFQTFILFAITLMSAAVVGNSIGFFTGALFKDAKRASGLAPVLLLPLMMFSGLYNKLGSIPGWISWVQYVSPFRYGLHMLLVNQYGQLRVSLVDGSVFNYRSELSITLEWEQNLAVMAGLSLCFYLFAFLLLRRMVTVIA